MVNRRARAYARSALIRKCLRYEHYQYASGVRLLPNLSEVFNFLPSFIRDFMKRAEYILVYLIVREIVFY